MKFFAAVKLATFASAAFAKAGLDLEKLQAAGDDNALKAALDSAGQKPNADAEAAIAEAAAENGRLSKALAEATASAAQLTALNGALSAAGLKVEKPEDFKAALDAHVSKQTTLALAKGGHPPVQEIDANATAAVGGTLSRAEFEKLKPSGAAAFCAQVRAGKATLKD